MGSQGQSGRRQFLRRILIDLAIMTVIGIVLALIGPFGSFQDPLAFRLVTWLSLSYLGYMVYSPMGYFVGLGHRALDLPRAWLWVFAVLVATVPMTALVYSLNFINRAFQWPSVETALGNYAYVLVIGGGITLLFNSLGTGPYSIAVEEDVVAPVPVARGSEGEVGNRPPFLDRLPPELGGDILALEMEDHYVRVHTALGSDLVLMRMRDAVAELNGLDGMQVHRSWWVARGAVDDVVRDGRNLRLKLAQGIEAPVSRANVATLKDAGWV